MQISDIFKKGVLMNPVVILVAVGGAAWLLTSRKKSVSGIGNPLLVVGLGVAGLLLFNSVKKQSAPAFVPKVSDKELFIDDEVRASLQEVQRTGPTIIVH